MTAKKSCLIGAAGLALLLNLLSASYLRGEVANFAEEIAPATKAPLSSLDEMANAPKPPNSPAAQLLKAIHDTDPNAVKAALDAGANPNWQAGLRVSSYYPYDMGVNSTVVKFAVDRICRPANFNPSVWTPWEKRRQIEQEQLCVRILALLFEAGAKLQESDDDILYYPIWCGRSSVVEFLLDKGANLNAKMLNDITPVELAEQYEHSGIVDMLVKNGGKPITLREAAQLRLVYCASEHSIVGMERAFKEGAVINGTNKANETALIATVQCAEYNIQVYAAVMYLLQKGADVNQQGKWNLKTTALHNTARLPLTPYMYMGSNDGYTEQIVKAHQTYQKLIVEALLKAGAFVSVRNTLEKSPLHYAAECNNHEIAEMLIQAGAKIMPKDCEGKTPLDYAESAEMIKLLRLHGAKEE